MLCLYGDGFSVYGVRLLMLNERGNPLRVCVWYYAADMYVSQTTPPVARLSMTIKLVSDINATGQIYHNKARRASSSLRKLPRGKRDFNKKNQKLQIMVAKNG